MTLYLKPISMNYMSERIICLSNFKIHTQNSVCVFHFAFKMSDSSLFKEYSGEKTQHFRAPLRTTL